MTSDILSNLPSISNDDVVNSNVDYEFDENIDVYDIKKGPASRVERISTRTDNFTEGVDYELVTDGDDIVSINWGIGGDSPQDGQLFTVDQTYRSVIARYTESHDLQFEQYKDDLETIVDDRLVSKATGDELDRIGALFGQIGKRRNRSNTEYRQFLQVVVDSFNGRGSRAGLKFAISAAVNGEPSDIEIIEDRKNLSYSIRINNVDTDFITSAVNELAELADPSGVELEQAVIILDGNTLRLDETGATVVDSYVGLGGETLTLDGNSQLI